MFNTLVDVPMNKKIELPVFEDVQMGISIGLAMEGFIPVTCYPRFDFLILAFNQIVNHLDKIRLMTRQEFKPRVIIRTAIGAKKPLDGGPQHTQDYTEIFRKTLTEIKVVKLTNKNKIFSTFKKILNDKDSYSYLVVEDGDKFNKD
jgi:pyruvate/2-oxoglutarate/acetoin dehydrogenase E1 component